MASSAIFMAILGLGCTFLPQEILAVLHQPVSTVLPLLVQILGALYLAFAMLNWMAKDSLIGGIYNRPAATGNLVHFTIVALALAKALLAGPREPVILALAALYLLFAVAFGFLSFSSPVKPG